MTSDREPLLEREKCHYDVTIAPIKVWLTKYKIEGVAIGIPLHVRQALIVRADYPDWGNDIWCISLDEIERI
jgi:hypothetical protein